MLCSNFIVVAQSANNSSYNKDLLKNNLLSFLNEEDLSDYNYQAVSHSENYRNKYFPHYRVIESKYLNLDYKYIQLFNFINNQKDKSIIAIEGRCGSGKTSLSNMFTDKYTVIRMDDFFIEKAKQTKETAYSPYGNVNYINVYNLLKDINYAFNNDIKELTFKAFDCSSQTYYDKTIEITNKIILEGTYSSSPYFKKYIDKLCFLNINKQTQHERISQRALALKFFNEWIPIEENYFKQYDVLSICDLII
jgi:uridine kinase